jgi:hypothetical protein
MKKQRILSVIFSLFLLATACTSPAPQDTDPGITPPGSTDTPSSTQPGGTPTDIWYALFEHTPVAWTTPLPPLETTVLDATYVKINPRLATPFPCRRCPDYALEGGLWKFSLDKGIFRIYYTMNGWRSLGSYAVAGDRLYLFNDPYCHMDTGIYNWSLVDGALTLTEVDDPCSQGLRAANLIDQPWLSCQPPNIEAKITDHWQKPEGCDPSR